VVIGPKIRRRWWSSVQRDAGALIDADDRAAREIDAAADAEAGAATRRSEATHGRVLRDRAREDVRAVSGELNVSATKAIAAAAPVAPCRRWPGCPDAAVRDRRGGRCASVEARDAAAHSGSKEGAADVAGATWAWLSIRVTFSAMRTVSNAPEFRIAPPTAVPFSRVAFDPMPPSPPTASLPAKVLFTTLAEP
jgi:hypothetical protein